LKGIKEKTMKTIKIIVLLAVALTLISCTFVVDLPVVRTGELQVMDINEAPEPDAEVSNIRIEMGGGRLNLSGGTDQLVEGTISYNFSPLQPVVTRDGSSVTLSQKTSTSLKLPEGNLKNDWDLKFGPMPIAFSLATGAYEGELKLGGLAIVDLSISDGASSSRVYFDEPNTTAMSKFTYATGASNVELHGLGNANVSQIEFSSGVGDYTLDFNGENSTDCNVHIKSGVSSIKIIIPTNARAEVIVDGGLSNVDLAGTWTIENNRYFAGTEGALITINIDMAVGDLQLIQQ